VGRREPFAIASTIVDGAKGRDTSNPHLSTLLINASKLAPASQTQPCMGPRFRGEM